MRNTLLKQKLVMYGIGAAAAAGATSEAGAALVYSGPISVTGGTIYFDLQNTVAPSTTINAADDFVLRQVTTSGNSSLMESFIYDVGSASAGISYATRKEGSVYVEYTLKLTAGQTIGAGNFAASPYFNTFGTTSLPSGGQGNGAGDWFNGNRGFIGLRLQVSVGNYLYGWADVQTNNFDNSAPGSFTLLGYAFNNVLNQAIAAGQVPEPSSLALLCAGAVGVAAFRRKKK